MGKLARQVGCSWNHSWNRCEDQIKPTTSKLIKHTVKQWRGFCDVEISLRVGYYKSATSSPSGSIGISSGKPEGEWPPTVLSSWVLEHFLVYSCRGQRWCFEKIKLEVLNYIGKMIADGLFWTIIISHTFFKMWISFMIRIGRYHRYYVLEIHTVQNETIPTYKCIESVLPCMVVKHERPRKLVRHWMTAEFG